MMMTAGTKVAAIVALAAAVSSGQRAAWGNAAARSFSTPEAASGAFSARPTRLEVEREELSIRCDDVEAHPQCRFQATYHLHNPAAEDEEATGVFYGSRETELQVRLDGADARAVVAPEEIVALDEAVRTASGVSWARLLAPMEGGRLPESAVPDRDRPPIRTGFHVRLAAGARAKLVFEGPLGATFSDNPNAYGGLAIPAYEIRHVALASHERVDARYAYLYLLAPLWTWAGARDVSIEIDVPARWRFSPHSLAAVAWTTSATGGRSIARTTVKGDPSGPPSLPLSFVIPGTTVWNGGPFVGAGFAFGDAHGLRLRCGYDLAGPRWILYSLALETNARDRFSGALLAEAASPNLAFIIPSGAFGLGAVVEHRSVQTATGARVQVALSWMLVSAILHVDLFPGQTDPARWSLLGQASF